jgi:DNA modification methylase
MIVPETIANGITLHPGDCLDVLKAMASASVDSCVTDPPYHLTSIVKRFGKSNLERDPETLADPIGRQSQNPYGRVSRGFMGQKWDGGDIAFRTELWAEVLRVLKPGGHLLAFSGTRTYHRMACAIEDAGFEIRDQIGWAYGSGFPKSHDVSKGIDRAAGAKRIRLGTKVELGVIHGQGEANKTMHEGWQRPWRDNPDADAHFVTAPATDEAKQWDGWGTALKPAWEPIVLARKPLEGTVAGNVLKHGTGAINIDGCRVGVNEADQAMLDAAVKRMTGNRPLGWVSSSKEIIPNSAQGRWPANLCHDGSDEVVGAFPDTTSGTLTPDMNVKPSTGWSGGSYADRVKNSFEANSGSAARFFYTAKADADDRLGSKHPTVKPLDLMQWLVRLVTPPNGVCLDPFAGTGTTGEAAFREGFRAVLIEREAEYQTDIRRRMSLVLGGPDERRRESIKASGKTEDAGPLFSGMT